MKYPILFLFLISLGLAGIAHSEDVRPYPLKTCIVSDEPLDPARKPLSVVYNGQEVRVCCRECRADFQGNPEKFLQKIPNGS